MFCRMISVPFWVEVQPTRDFVSIPHNVSHLSTVMNGKQLGLEGKYFISFYIGWCFYFWKFNLIDTGTNKEKKICTQYK